MSQLCLTSTRDSAIVGCDGDEVRVLELVIDDDISHSIVSLTENFSISYIDILYKWKFFFSLSFVTLVLRDRRRRSIPFDKDANKSLVIQENQLKMIEQPHSQLIFHLVTSLF